MFKNLKKLGRSIVPRLMLTIGLIVLLSLSTLAYMNIKHQKDVFQTLIVEETYGSGDTVTPDARVLNHRKRLLSTKQILLPLVSILLVTVTAIFFLVLWNGTMTTASGIEKLPFTHLGSLALEAISQILLLPCLSAYETLNIFNHLRLVSF